ncbi:hypothetical protein C8R44DRAFT_777826, partial [Mycena epipterygia]
MYSSSSFSTSDNDAWKILPTKSASCLDLIRQHCPSSPSAFYLGLSLFFPAFSFVRRPPTNPSQHSLPVLPPLPWLLYSHLHRCLRNIQDHCTLQLHRCEYP